MARLPRLFAPGIPHYVRQEALAGRLLCRDEDAFRFLATLLDEACRRHGVALHAYALLPDAFGFLATPRGNVALAAALQTVGRRYVPYVNRTTGARGPLWGRRYRSTLVDPDAFLVPTMRHVERSPVAAGLVSEPAQWRWSSCRHHVGIEQAPEIVDCAAYWALGNTPFERQARYRVDVDTPLAPALVERIDAAVDKGWALGDAAFVAVVEEGGSRRAGPRRRGRPRSMTPAQRMSVVSPITDRDQLEALKTGTDP